MTRAALIVAVLLLALPGDALAHAQLEGTTPARGAQLDAAPREVSFRFSEDVTASAGSVRVFDGRGREVQQGAPEEADKRVSIRLPADLPDGGYTATYRVISADSHPVSGGFSFTIGAGGPGPQSVDRLLQAGQSGPVTATALGVARAVQYAAIALAAGTLIFLLFLWPRGLDPARTRPLLLLAAVAGVASAVAALLLERVEADVTLGDVLGTRFGLAWAVGIVAWLLIAALHRSARAAAVPAAALCLLPAFAGHASVESGVMLVANVIHVVAIAGWIGGLVVLLFPVRLATRELPDDERSRLRDEAVRRFSAYATIAIGVILASGIVQSIVELSAWSELWRTQYGRAILIKLGLFAVMLGFGAINRRGVRLPVLRAEVAAGIVVLGVTGALATYPPAKAADTGPVSANAVLGPARLELTLDPARIGINELHVYLFDRRTGAQWTRAKELTLTAARGAVSLPVAVNRAGPGHYVAQQATLPTRGTWTVTVAARVSDFDEYTTKLRVPVR